jgi:predicted RNase H-like nuclease (RuvC/YqgF family)
MIERILSLPEED